MSERVPQHLPLSQLTLSRFNARSSRSPGAITALAERMRRNGFEITRALWVVGNDEGLYEVFAGGTRLAAAREAGLTEIPCLMHSGYDLEAISRLADEDNENDEYHVPVPLPDVWAEYRRLKEEERWTQQQIADAKGVARPRVAERIMYAEFPEKVLRLFVQNDFLKEGHAAELGKLYKFVHYEPWLTRDQAFTEILAGVLKTHRGGSDGKAPTASVFTKAVSTTNEMVTAVETALAGFPASADDDGTAYVPRAAFLAALAAKTVRTTKDVLAAAREITNHLHAIEGRRLAAIAREQQRLTEAELAAQRRQQALAEEQARNAYRDHILSCFQEGDCRTLIHTLCPDNVRLVLTDPPYGKQFQSKRRAVTAKKAVVEGDASLDEALALFADMLTVLLPKLAPDAHLFVFTHQDSYGAFCDVLQHAGFTLRRTMTWLKGNHGLGDTTRGEALTETEWVIHAVQGNPKFTENIDRGELLDFPGTQDSDHPMEKPQALLEHLIQRGTEPGEVVVDPFAGTANTLLALLARHRQGWACEIDPDFYRDGAAKLYDFITKREG